MENLLFFAITFTVILLIYLGIYFIKKKRNSLKDMKELEYLIRRGRININNINYNNVCLILVFVNSLIISVTATIVTMLNVKYIFQMIIGFCLLMVLIYSIYEIIGQWLKRREVKKDEFK